MSGKKSSNADTDKKVSLRECRRLVSQSTGAIKQFESDIRNCQLEIDQLQKMIDAKEKMVREKSALAEKHRDICSEGYRRLGIPEIRLVRVCGDSSRFSLQIDGTQKTLFHMDIRDGGLSPAGEYVDRLLYYIQHCDFDYQRFMDIRDPKFWAYVYKRVQSDMPLPIEKFFSRGKVYRFKDLMKDK